MSNPRAGGASDGSGLPAKPSGDGKAGFSINVSRIGKTVSLALTAADEYSAIELYEHFVLALRKGHLSLELN